MQLKDFFKKKLKKKPIERKIKSAEKAKEKEIKKEMPASPRILTKTITGLAFKVLKNPHITEKASDLAKKNQYVFKIYSRANKVEVKKAISETYGVDVVSVKIINIPQKKRRLGRQQGVKPGYKKAIVKIKEGQKIEVLPR